MGQGRAVLCYNLIRKLGALNNYEIGQKLNKAQITLKGIASEMVRWSKIHLTRM